MGSGELRYDILQIVLPNVMYSVNHHLTDADLGCADFDLKFPYILTSCSAHSAKMTSAQAESGREWNSQNLGNPNSGPRADGSPCTDFIIWSSLSITFRKGGGRIAYFGSDPVAFANLGTDV